MKRVIFTGVGGQSVRIISHVLAMALKELGYEVALLFDYDSSIRNQRITAYLSYDRKPIENPMIDEADILIRLHEKGDQLIAQKTICDTGLCTDEEVPFGMMGIEKFGQAIFGNMIALGR
ncbi:MAG: 2-oxoacid:acceptor oxidoreductase family protein, partial [Desulfobacterales bacterium]|nr:2-oxoacid:acceptor oxidoreductase family protein [Desulfobacterales bacterium]